MRQRQFLVIIISIAFFLVFLRWQSSFSRHSGDLISSELNTLRRDLENERNFRIQSEQEIARLKEQLQLESEKRTGLEDRLESVAKQVQSSSAGVTKKGKTRFIFGIPSVYRREKNYLPETMRSLLSNLGEAYHSQVKFVIYNADTPPERHLALQQLRNDFKSEFDDGMIEVIANTEGYEEMRRPLNLTHGDSLERVKWRSKQVLDFAYLMEYCKDKADYYIHLEDDIVAAKNYLQRIDDWLRKNYESRSDWIILSFFNPWSIEDGGVYNPDSFSGFIGQLYRSSDLEEVIRFFKRRYNDSPADWLMKDYLKESSKKVFAKKPCLFQHIGVLSSLDGKTQGAKAIDFDDG
mmetsp:Transcript_17697/g.29104  ORF Transcript_17697/g.29104 Transcript_17697/m.29104 type:complete len:350 (+) Transcript_17697:178-1227(+)|eukprot:CAMPEP_0184674142 /NCGR_PEP_ID=MMETSP0308-20130426/87075_1 /TAXON_ID=38269 /ORGANISM="Gloeochaete witrockiana, Strain SAG 46.84" /LENGTH=349 /DNA_ID=CAMNT_0027121715 /DNA_START=151 /DNA_END=1200 /DNA_ORIENTATION=-